MLKTKYMIFSMAHKVKNCPKIDVKIHDLSISRCDKKRLFGSNSGRGTEMEQTH